MLSVPIYKMSQHKDLPCSFECMSYVSYPLHTHKNYEIEYIIGHDFHNVLDGTDYKVDGVMCFVYMPYTHHCFYSDAGESSTVYKIEFKEQFIPTDVMEFLLKSGVTAIRLDQKQQSRIISVIESIFQTFTETIVQPYLSLLLRADICKMITLLYEAQNTQIEQKSTLSFGTDPVMQKVISYIRKNYNKDISLYVLSELTGMTPGYFGKYFKEHTGIRYSDYLTAIRMNSAMNLLKMTAYSIKRISTEVGYYSESGFIKAFTNYFGQHPLSTRNIQNRKDISDITLSKDDSISKKHNRQMKNQITADSINTSKKRMPIPFPKKIHFFDNERHPIEASVSTSARFTEACDVFCSYVKRMFDIDMSIVTNNAAIVFREDLSIDKEAYHIEIVNGTVTILASTAEGANHGASVLLQLLENGKNCLSIPSFIVSDQPDTEWRGLMIDLARGVFTVSELYTYIDLCYFYRMNYLHLHFADGRVYTLPSKNFPKLNTSCYSYTQQDIINLNEYAKKHGITIIPEIEIPGHADILVTQYPEFFGSVHGDTICPGRDGIFSALEILINEVCDLFPDVPYLHIGCDEVNFSKWDSCPECKKFMERNCIPSAKYLYTYVINYAAQIVKKYCKTPVIWEGFTADSGMEQLSRDIIIMVFQSIYCDAVSLVSAGFRVVNTSWQPLYIVPSRPKYWMPQDIYRWKYNRWLYEDAVDDSSPIDVEDFEAVLGAELCVWESADFSKSCDIVYANLPATAERVWNSNQQYSYEEFSYHALSVFEKLRPLINGN